jgi:hypothetical protein
MGKHLKTLRTDGGGEYIAKAVEMFLKEKGVKQEITTLDTIFSHAFPRFYR